MNELKIKVEQDNSKQEEKAQIEKWEIEDAIRILVKAEEIKADKKMMALIEPKLKEKAQAMNNAADVLYRKKEEK